jgi:glycosyltransferase involved in cell wall biosynthesis
VRRLFFLIPGDLETRTGGYGYDRRIIAGLTDRGWRVDVGRLDDNFPTPTAQARADAAQQLADIGDGSTVLVDGLALGALPDEVERAASRLRIVALVHHPLALETGIAPARARTLEASERRALAAVRSVIVTSRATASRLAEYGVAGDRLAIVEPGTDAAPLARGSGASADPSPIDGQLSALSPQPSGLRVALLCVATLTPRKAHELLLRALAAIPSRNWRLACAGSLELDPQTASRVLAQIHEHRLDDRVSLLGDLDTPTLAREYDRADLFVLPTLYEGFGMAVAEALARGLPVVSTRTGGIADLVGDEAGIVVPPGDLPAMTGALARVIGDAELRARLAGGARGVRDRLPTWDASTASMARVLERVMDS